MKDYYQILGVPRNANDDEIKKSFRRLASQHHPDKGGDTQKFQEIQEAYAVLSDPARRHEYDHPQVHVRRGPAGPFDFQDIFNGMFSARANPGSDWGRRTMRVQLYITLRDVAVGGNRIISLATPSGQGTAEITIPAGIEDGESIRYPQIAPGNQDIVVLFRVQPDPNWERIGTTIHGSIEVMIWDLILGTTVNVVTITDTVISVVVPPNTQPGTTLRVRGHGLPGRQGSARGDLMLEVRARLPESIPQDLVDRIRQERYP